MRFLPRNDITIRSFTEGDEESIATLFTRAHAPYVGYVPRTTEYWTWCVRDRPGVSYEDILVAENKGRKLGYGAIDPNGDVLEFAVDPDLPARKRKKVVTHLVGALETRSREKGLQTIRFLLPEPDRLTSRALRRIGYSLRDKRAHLQWVIVDLAGFLKRILGHRIEHTSAKRRPKLILQVEPGQYSFVPHRRLGIDFGPPVNVEVEPSPKEYEIAVHTDMSTLTDLVFRKSTFRYACSEGLLTVDPKSRTSDAKRLFDMISVSMPWYTPTADAR